MVAAPRTAAALRSRLSALLTRFRRPPPTPPDPRIDAKRSFLSPAGWGREGAGAESRPGGRGGGGGPATVPRPGGRGGGGGPLLEGIGGGGGAREVVGKGGAGGAPPDGSGGGGGGPVNGVGALGTGRGWLGGSGWEMVVEEFRWLGRGGGGGGPEDGGAALGVLGGSGGGAALLGGTACP